MIMVTRMLLLIFLRKAQAGRGEGKYAAAGPGEPGALAHPGLPGFGAAVHVAAPMGARRHALAGIMSQGN